MIALRLLFVLCLAVPTPVLAFPDNGVLETFTAANGTSPPNANWTESVIFGASSSGLAVQGNGVTRDAAGEGDGYWNAASFNANSEAYITLSEVTQLNYLHVCLRLANIGANTTDGYCIVAAIAEALLAITRVDNAVESSTLRQDSITFAAGDSVGIKAIGSSICQWHKTSAGSWRKVGCVTDTTYSAGGRIGITIDTDANNISAGDNFGGGNATADRSGGTIILF